MHATSSAWLHHKGRNKHHFEYWTDYSIRKPGHPIEGMRMPRRYVAEMWYTGSEDWKQDIARAHRMMAEILDRQK